MANQNHLKDQGYKLGFAVTSVESLKVGKDYLIVDMGLNEWNGGHKYLGMDRSLQYHLFEDMLYPGKPPVSDIFIFSKEDMAEMINLSQIAEEG